MVPVLKVRLQIDIKEGSGDPVHRVFERNHVDSRPVLDLARRVQRDDVAQFDPQVLSDDAVHSNLAVVRLLIGEGNAHRRVPLLALNQHAVSAEQTQF